MAFHDEDVHLEAELQPLPLESRTTGRRAKVLVALGLGLAAAATYSIASSRSPAASSLKGLQTKVEEVVPEMRIVEGNMGDFIDHDRLRDEAHHERFGTSIGDVAASIFDHFVKKSSIDSEMTSGELESYKYRFVAAMLGMQESNTGPMTDYVERAKQHLEGTKPMMTEALAQSINMRQSSFQVKMQPWLLEESADSLNDRLIKVPYEVSPENKWKQHSKSLPQGTLQVDDLPVNFESSEQWPKCKEVIENPHNQGRCGSCWAFSANGALDSRLCIVTGGEFSGPTSSLSRGFSTSCVTKWDGCQGGWPHFVYDSIEESEGLPSTNCVPYFAGSDYSKHWHQAMPAPPCPKKCDKRHTRDIHADMFKPAGIANYQLVDKPDVTGIKQLKAAIYHEGPCPYAFYANYEFMGYIGGVFNSGCGERGNHAVQAIGWGQENDQEYISSLNSWSKAWGVEGKFKVAYCVVWHFTVPGTISNQGYALPIPAWP